MISKQSKIKLAKMLKLVSEVVTQQGILYSDTDLAVGEEVFTYGDNDDLVVANDGEWQSDKLVYVVKDGKIAEIREYVNAETTETQPINEEEMANEEGEQGEGGEEETEKTESVEDLKKIIEDKDAEIADLRKEIEEIKSANQEVVDRKDKEISDLQATIAEYKEREGKSVEEPIEDQEKFSRQTEKQNNVLNLLKSRRK